MNWLTTLLKFMDPRFLSRIKSAAAQTDGNRYYGGNMTLHRTGCLDVETHNGKVVAVWFRCCPLPFKQAEVGEHRAKDMNNMSVRHELVAVETKEV